MIVIVIIPFFIVMIIMCKNKKNGLHEGRVCLNKELVQWDYLDKEVCDQTNGKHKSKVIFSR